jgi:stage V sporulation protein AB
MNEFLSIITGLAGGLVVGGGIVAFFTVLGILTRIIEFSKTKSFTAVYEIAIVLGSVGSTLVYLYDFHLPYLEFLTIFLGLTMGVFVGMVAAALTETLDIISDIVNTLGIIKWVYVLVFTLIFGKIAGSILFWILPGF